MCLQCHLGLSDETILNQLQDAINKGTSDFNEYNSTSISHIIIATSGYNGLALRNTAIKLLKMYLDWIKLNPTYILDENSTPEKLIKIIEKGNPIKDKSLKSLEKYFEDLNFV